MDKDTATSKEMTSGAWERQTLEKLVFATLREQRAARRWKIFFRLLWIGVVLAFIALIYRDVAPATVVMQPHTAVIEVRGIISADTEASAHSIVAALRSAFEAPGVQGVLLLIDSPGGSPVQAGIIADEIHRLKALHDKPIHAVVEEVSASASYYIASAADNIYVDKASIVGSIGVSMSSFGFTELMDKIGVERRLLTAGENKGLMDPFSPTSEVQQQQVQEMLDDIHQQFIEVVQRGRGERLKDTEEIFSGRVWSGQRAVTLGLADGLGHLEQVARDVVGAEIIIDYTQRENVAQRLVRRFGAGVGEGAWLTLRDSAAVWR